MPRPRPSLDLLAAQDIMGRHFFSPAQVALAFGVAYDANATALRTIPFDEQALYERRDTHLLVPVLPISLRELRRRPDLESMVNCRPEDDAHGFARRVGRASWHLICIEAVPGSLGGRWREQRRLLASNERVPDARTLVQSILMAHLVTGIPPRSVLSLRSSDCNDDRRRVTIGVSPDKLGVTILFFLDQEEDYRVGIANEFALA